MPSYSSEQFRKEYELRLDKEFEYDSHTAQWAPSFDGPRFWGEEDESIQLKHDDPLKGNVPSSASALTPDGRYLAVSTNAVIQIYDIGSLALCLELVGHENNVWQLHFVDIDAEQSGHRLFSYGAEVSGSSGKVHIWDIGADGQLLKDQRPMPLPVEKMAEDAVVAIIGEFQVHHDQNDEAVEAVRNAFAEKLEIADAQNRVKSLPTFFGRFPGFGTQPVSHDGTTVMVISHDRTTHGGERLPEELPQIVLNDIETQREKCRLKGHEDAIMWAGWSLDDKTIATACWDKTYRLWDTDTGECKHVIGKTGGQNWAGAFLPDGKHILLSGGQPVKVGIYNIETAEEVTHLETPEPTKLDHWMRYFQAHPIEDLIILQNARALLAWRPLSSSSTTFPEVQEIFALTRVEERIKDRFAAVYTLKWVDEGNILIAQATDKTTFVWDVRKGWKWRFQRPRAWKAEYSGDVFFVKRKGTAWVASLDGDSKVRFWKL